MRRAYTYALLALAVAGCGVINGLKGGGDVPALGTWQGPAVIDQGASAQSDYPRLALGQGALWLAWESWDTVAKRSSVWVSSRPIPGGVWTTPQAAPQVAGFSDGAFYPQLELGASGDPVLAFETSNLSGSTTSYGVWSARVQAGRAIAASDLVRVDAATSHTPQLSQGHSLAVDLDGNAFLAWGEAGALLGSVSAAGGKTWTAPATLDSNNAFAWAAVEVAAGSGGQALLAWPTTTDALSMPLYVSGGALGTGSKTSFFSATNPQGAVLAARGSRTLAAWVNGGALLAQPSDSGGWGQTATITSTGLAYYSNLAIAVNGNGQAVAVWRDSSAGYVDGYTGVAMASFFDGVTWSSPQNISLPGVNRKAWWLSVDLDDYGTAVAAWADFDEGGTFTRIWANVLRQGGGGPSWSGPVTIDAASPGVYLANKPENFRAVHVKLDPLGRGAYVVWIQHGPGSDTTARTWGNGLE